MSKSNYPLKLPVSVRRPAHRLAKEDGVSLNQWIAVAVAQKVGVTETAAEFFASHAPKAKGTGLSRYLKKAPKAEPLPEGRATNN